MRLLRLVIATFRPALPGWEMFTVRMNDVRVSTLGSYPEEKQLRVLLCGDIALAMPLEVTTGGFVRIPDGARVNVEATLDRAIDLLAVAAESHRSVGSPSPHVLLCPETDGDWAWLSDKAGLEDQLGGRECASASCAMPTELVTDAVGDRWDGVALLADALASDRGIGQYRELVRFFERAFGRTTATLAQVMFQFLACAPMKFGEDEIHNWTVSLRHPSVHADRNVRLTRSRDVTLLTPRMVAAAYDVLLNKVKWHSPDAERRSVWSPNAGSCDPNGSDVFLTAGKAAELKYTLFDRFGSYPLDLGACIASPLTGTWPSGDLQKQDSGIKKSSTAPRVENGVK